MATLQFYPLDVTYKIVDENVHTYIFGRTTDNKQVCVVDTKTQPYFYIVPQDNPSINNIMTKIKDLRIERKGLVAKVTKAELAEAVFNGKKLTVVKVYINMPKALPNAQYAVKSIPGVRTVLEADIPYKRKYWIDKQITPLTLLSVEGELSNERMKIPVFKAEKMTKGDTTLEKLRILAFDIETYNPLGKVFDPSRFPILMVSLYGENYKKVITWKRFPTKLDYIEFVEGEGQLIQRLKEEIENYAPDAIAGYSSDNFDFPYILRRAEKHKVKFDINLDNTLPKLKKRARESVETVGIMHLDVFNFIKQIARSIESETLKLDDVSHALLGEKKDEVEIDKLAAVWDSGSVEIEKFCKYNLKDSELTYKLLMKMLPNITELIKLIGQPLQAIEKMGYGQLVEWYLMKRSIEFDHLIPNKPSNRETERRMYEKAKGAFVYEPDPGIYKDLFVFDFRSLYPSIIITHNISPETLECNCCMDAPKVPIEGKKIWFCKKKKGFFSTILDDVVTRRQRIKEILKTVDKEKKALLNARQESLKILSNSFYGYLGFFGARWYSKDCTEAVTAYGRFYIQQVIDKAKAKKFPVIYADTDSIFMGLGELKREDVKKFGDDVNYELPELMELEYEGHYKSALFVSTKDMQGGAKKKYALMTDAGKVIIKGFESVRRNWSLIAKQVQETVIKQALKQEKGDKALIYVKKEIERLRKKEVPIEYMIINTQMTKPIAAYDVVGPHVAVAKLMQARGETVRPGNIISYVVIEGTGKIRDRAKLPDEVKPGEYDAEYYINNQILPSVEKILEVFGYKKEDITEQKDQSKLDSFFG